MAERFGVTTETVGYTPFNDALKVSGEILPSPADAATIVAPTSGIISFSKSFNLGAHVRSGATIAGISATGVSGGDKNLAAKANLDAAKRELDRLKPLYDERLVTASDYNSAVRAYEEAKAGYSMAAAAGSVTSPISGVVTAIDVKQGQYVEVGTPIASVATSQRLTLRADVPQRYYNRTKSFNGAIIELPYSNKTVNIDSLGGQRIVSSDNMAAQSPGYVPVFFSLDNNGEFIAGSGVDVYLQSDSSDNVISVPMSALSEQQGQYYVFVKLDDECYRKALVSTGRSNGNRIEIKSGIEPGDNIVVTGTTTVRIAESSGNIPEGHSHNH